MTEVARRIKGGNEREIDPANNQFSTLPNSVNFCVFQTVENT